MKIIRVRIPRPPNEFNQFIDVIPENALSKHRLAPILLQAIHGLPQSRPLSAWTLL
jgi:hypothetical protein